jgi:hypothetical protein
MLAEVFFSIFSRGCKHSNFSTQYGGKGIFFYNTFLKTTGFLKICLYRKKEPKHTFYPKNEENSTFHSVP